MNERGIFITFEGGDGVGKSTQIKFLANALEEQGFEVVLLREPGGTSVGESLRSLVLDPAHENMAPEAELLIYEAARSQIVDEVIRPALDRGAVVLCDRFYDSTVAYQVYGRGLDRDFVDQANMFATRGLKPDRTILLVNTDANIGFKRVEARGDTDRLERAGADFHNRVLTGFMDIAAEEPERVRVVSASDLPASVHLAVLRHLEGLFPEGTVLKVFWNVRPDELDKAVLGGINGMCEQVENSLEEQTDIKGDNLVRKESEHER